MSQKNSTEKSKQMGGKREGAGRPKGTGKYGEPTQAIRVPQSFIPKIKAWLVTHKRQTCLADVEPIFSEQPLPLFATKIPAGFPSPADDYIETRLDLNRHLIKHPAASFFVRVQGDSMIGAGIYPNDLLVVDRSLEPIDGKVVIAVVDGELTVKRLKIRSQALVLAPENDKYPEIIIGEANDFRIWGVVTNVIHAL